MIVQRIIDRLKRLFAKPAVFYIGGSEILPPPLSVEEETAAVAACQAGDRKARDKMCIRDSSKNGGHQKGFLPCEAIFGIGFCRTKCPKQCERHMVRLFGQDVKCRYRDLHQAECGYAHFAAAVLRVACALSDPFCAAFCQYFVSVHLAYRLV